MKKPLLALLFAGAISVAGAADAPRSTTPPELKGEVVEVLDVGAYTYLRLKTSAGEKWAAVNRAPVKKGSQVTIFDPAEMQDFESRALGRTFPSIYFGTVGVAAPRESATAHPGPKEAGTDLGKVHGGLANTSSEGDFKVAKAQGSDARTIAEIHSGRSALKDKAVKVRAKVAKVTPNVMGTNWVHLRDGSGSAADESNDILVTTRAEPKVGDVVLATGVVRTDVTLGAGYVYKVLVENASIAK